MTYLDLNAEELRIRRRLAGVLFWVVAAIAVIFFGVNAIPQRDKPNDSVALEPAEGSSASNLALSLKKDGDGYIQPDEQTRAVIIPPPQPTVTSAPLNPAEQPSEAAVAPASLKPMDQPSEVAAVPPPKPAEQPSEAPLKPTGQPTVAAVTPAPPKPTEQPGEAAVTPAPLKPTGQPSEAAAPLKPPAQRSVATVTPAPLKQTEQPSEAAVTPAPLKPTGQPTVAAVTPAPLKPTSQPTEAAVTPAPSQMAGQHTTTPQERERRRQQLIKMRKFYSALYSPIGVDIRKLKARQGNND